jgi:hypothetical protein
MVRIALRPIKITSIVAVPFPIAVAFPLKSIVITAGFVVDQLGKPPEDGGGPSPSSTFTQNDNVSPIRMLSTAGEICVDSTGANTTRGVSCRGRLGAVGIVLTSEQPTQTAVIGIINANRM